MIKVEANSLFTLAPGVLIACGDTVGVFMGKELTTGDYELWDGKAKQDVAQLLEDAEEEFVEVLNTNVDIDTLIKIAVADIMILANEGWTLAREDKHFDLTMYIDRLKVLVTTKNILSNVENKQK